MQQILWSGSPALQKLHPDVSPLLLTGTFEAGLSTYGATRGYEAKPRVGYLVISVYEVFSGGLLGVLLDLLGNWGNCKFGGGCWIRGIQIWGCGGCRRVFVS